MLINGSETTPRNIDVDPYFDNTKLVFGEAGIKVPYTPQNTWKDPNGDRQHYLKHTNGLTTMQKHVAFFDGDCDGVIWPMDTLFGFLALGFGAVLSAMAVVMVHGALSYPTLPTKGNRLIDWIPDPFMRVYVANIHRCKHGSDSESYDRRGHFRQSQFEAILDDYSTHHDKDALSFWDAMAMIRERRDLMDVFGCIGFMFEWGSTYLLLWPADGYMHKDDLVGVFDGSAFVVLAHRHKRGRGGGAGLKRKKV